MATVWKAPNQIIDHLEEIRNKAHLPRLQDVPVAVALSDGKAFIKNRLNLGKVQKFSDFNKIWQKDSHDFCITLVMDVWESILNNNQRDALLDLHLTRIEPVYEPEIIIENGKKIIVKDDMGRTKMTENIKLDKDGNPKWNVLPIDLVVITRSIRRYGFWFDDLVELQKAVVATQA